jgi:hypothetical protein
VVQFTTTVVAGSVGRHPARAKKKVLPSALTA